MKYFYWIMELILPNRGEFLIKKSFWFLYSSLLFLFIDFLSYLKDGEMTKISLHYFLTILNVNYFDNADEINQSITGWLMVDKYINFIFISNISISFTLIFLNLLILGFILNLLLSYFYDKHTEVIKKENKKP